MECWCEGSASELVVAGTNAYQSNPRNKLIAEAFYLARKIEKYGSGISRIRHELTNYPHIQFCIEEIANGILVSFKKLQKISATLAVTEVTGEVMRLLTVCDDEKEPFPDGN